MKVIFYATFSMPHILYFLYYISYFAFSISGIGRGGKIERHVSRSKQGVRSIPIQSNHCLQQRNTKQAPFDVWDAPDALLRKPQKRRSIFRDKKADEKTCKKQATQNRLPSKFILSAYNDTAVVRICRADTCGVHDIDILKSCLA